MAFIHCKSGFYLKDIWFGRNGKWLLLKSKIYFYSWKNQFLVKETISFSLRESTFYSRGKRLLDQVKNDFSLEKHCLPLEGIVSYTQRTCYFQLKKKWLPLKGNVFSALNSFGLSLTWKQVFMKGKLWESALSKNSFSSWETLLPIKENAALIQKSMYFYSKDKVASFKLWLTSNWRLQAAYCRKKN